MDGHEIEIGGERLVARPSGALWWPARSLLCVADLHLGKSERMARRGGTLLPPYETAETLARLGAEIAALAPQAVICLGDSFDDTTAALSLAAEARAALDALMSGRDWLWIAGNHDPAGIADLTVGGLTFRHAAQSGAEEAEISGHYHPKLRMALRGRAISRRCFVGDGRRLILPAFGAFTGGLDADNPAVRGLFGDGAVAVLVGDPCVAVPLGAVVSWRAGPRAGRLRLALR